VLWIRQLRTTRGFKGVTDPVPFVPEYSRSSVELCVDRQGSVHSGGDVHVQTAARLVTTAAISIQREST
jgi:hypothetical protein